MNSPISIKTQALNLHLRSLKFTKHKRLACAYLALAIVPFVIAQLLGMEFTGVYSSVLGAVNLIAMMVFFMQFPLAGRLKYLPLFANIDWGITKHKQLGKYLGIFFFLHPILIVLPKGFISIDDLWLSIVSVVTSPNMLTGIIAWLTMAVWVLMSIYKDKLNLRYETWRLLHVIGFAIIATLATLHVTTIGSHGQFNHAFNITWWSLYCVSMALLIYNYFIKPRNIKKHPYAINALEKISECDWKLSIKSKTAQSLNYQAGQFVWINTSGNPYNLEQHPFSIVTASQQHKMISFIIRELGDYTSSLSQLELGATVYIDGPYGNMTLEQANLTRGITLIAGGAGIAPILGLLRQLAEQHDPRPIRLIYANHTLDRMVCLYELIALEQTMVDFKLKLVCEHIENNDLLSGRHLVKGFIDLQQIAASVTTQLETQWTFYVCGPESMLTATTGHFKQLGVANNQIHFEQLAF
ncbi:ferric reductase-like transmembrane domain-containing protein [Shewanella sp. MEBiC00475]|uniref:ferredoxin reductase family protein n=1 Tax=Shewanella sp. MEBiC00475 TaxID=2575361 RepID=UPI0015865A29|nr:ferric reductase-like transmembrane domain-containing protein [Shewanella sp. MEBiC00475]